MSPRRAAPRLGSMRYISPAPSASPPSAASMPPMSCEPSPPRPPPDRFGRILRPPCEKPCLNNVCRAAGETKSHLDPASIREAGAHARGVAVEALGLGEAGDVVDRAGGHAGGVRDGAATLEERENA